jgi:hypothetical protein
VTKLLYEYVVGVLPAALTRGDGLCRDRSSYPRTAAAVDDLIHVGERWMMEGGGGGKRIVVLLMNKSVILQCIALGSDLIE